MQKFLLISDAIVASSIMAVLIPNPNSCDSRITAGERLPRRLQQPNSTSVFGSSHVSIKVMTLHVSKGLEFPAVALVDAGHIRAKGEDELGEARLFYVGATRAKQRLVIGSSGRGRFAVRLRG